MTSTNKAFAYVVKTPKEDHMVSRVLSGWRARDNVACLSIGGYDGYAEEAFGRLRDVIFSSSLDHTNPAFNVSRRALDVLLTYLIRALPSFLALHPVTSREVQPTYTFCCITSYQTDTKGNTIMRILPGLLPPVALFK